VFTQCSNCETVFKLSAEVLRAAGGQVRCGKCGEVFNALAHLAEDAGAFTKGESEFDLENRADSILQTRVPPQRLAAEKSEEFAPPGIEIARLQILDWNEDELPGAIAAAAAGEEPIDDTVGETSMEFTLPPGELDRIFVETKARKRSSAAPPADPNPSPEPDQEPEPESIAADDLLEVSAHPEAAGFGAQKRADANSGFEVSEDVRREMLAGLEPEDLSIGYGRRSRDSTHGLWLTAAVAAAALLLAQMVHRNREWLAAHAPLGSVLSALYSKLGAPVPPPLNLSAYQLRQWGVTGDPTADGTLRVRASILNTAAQLEPFPLLRVTLANRFGSSIGARDFEASEYMGKPIARMLAPGERVDATMDILDPGKSAEGFEIDVCLRAADKKISCANDQAAPKKR
jgi:predicted Zn finger-like uncharacterized protein